ncbi:MAG: TrkA family potassium uptake protein [Thermotogae bacterium]|nr:TrkA family potassium uptake protein [Thermotogota bacterium]
MQITVIGLGRFGSALAETLIERGHEVIVIDKDERLVQKFVGKTDTAIVADATDDTVLRSIGVQDMDVVVVAIGDDVEASVLVCISLMELGAKNIIAKAEDERHARILGRIGVDRIIQPEKESALHLADLISYPTISDRFNISEEHAIVEIKAPKSFIGRRIRDLELRRKYNVLIVGIRRKEPVFDDEGNIVDLKEKFIAPPDPDEEITDGDVLVLLTPTEMVEEIARWE